MIFYNFLIMLSIWYLHFFDWRYHNPLVGGSSPLTATIFNPLLSKAKGFFNALTLFRLKHPNDILVTTNIAKSCHKSVIENQTTLPR